MKKILKVLFSSALPIALAFIVQLVGIWLVFHYFAEQFVWFHIVCIILATLAFLHIIYKKQQAEFKLSWTVLLLVFPIFGLVVYILYGNPRMTKTEYRTMLGILVEARQYAPLKENNITKENLGEYAGIANYIHSQTDLSGDFHNRVTFLKNGETFFEELKAELKKAEKYIFMEFFIIHEGKMWSEIKEILLEKVKQGIEVRVIYDDIGSLNYTSFCKDLNKLGIDCIRFNKMRPTLSSRQNNRDHRKIVVIDGKVGFTGGANIGDEYINVTHPFGKWKDLAVKLEGSTVNNLAIFFLIMNESVRKNQTDFSKYLNQPCEKFDDAGYIQPFCDGPKPFYSEQIAETNYINLINSAKDYIYITTPYLIPDYNLLSALKNAALRGVDVRIITPHIPDKKIILSITRSNYKFLHDAGVKIKEYTVGFIHAKEMIVDDKIAFIGTVNLDYRSLVHHFEDGVNLYNCNAILDMKKDYFETLELCDDPEEKIMYPGFIKRVLHSVLMLFAPLL